MDQRVGKLARVLRDEDLARRLVEAGLMTPQKIKSATNAELDDAIGRTNRVKVRSRLG